uniref:Nucleotide-diphospho-sugar transferase domain-containing protein n=1 Tax=Chromulina nebulosa TaxID=96789 RepID=A0A7S0XF92_9STRA
MLLNYLNDKSLQDVDYFMWIDADAIIINDLISLDDIVNKSKHKKLIISEDVNTCCYVNAGVLLVRNCEWSRSFWTDVWNNSNYFNVKHYEQSAIIKCLRMRDEGLNNLKPFHSFVISTESNTENATNRFSIKLFPNVAVVSHCLLNSNSICTTEVDFNSIDIQYYDTINKINSSTQSNEYYSTSSAKRKPNYMNVKDMSPPLFIYHPAGCSDKLKYLLDYLERVNIYVPETLKRLDKMKLNRSKSSIQDFITSNYVRDDS